MKSLTITMKADDVAEILLYDQIGKDAFFGDGISAKDFKDAVKAIKAKTLNLRINSPGGSVFEGSAMLTALDEFKGRVEVDIDGVAASAASVVAMGGDTIRMGSNALMMIHNPYGMVMGGADEMRHTAGLLDKVKGQILDAYERKSKAGRNKLDAWMSAETWFDGAEAVDAGLADSVSEPVRVAALLQHAGLMAKFGFKHVPTIPQDGPEWEATRARQAVAAKLMGA